MLQYVISVVCAPNEVEPVTASAKVFLSETNSIMDSFELHNSA